MERNTKKIPAEMQNIDADRGKLSRFVIRFLSIFQTTTWLNTRTDKFCRYENATM